MSGQEHTLAMFLPPGKEPPALPVEEAGWAREPVWIQRLEEKTSAPVGDRTPAAQSVASHYIDWATRLRHNTILQIFIKFVSKKFSQLCFLLLVSMAQHFPWSNQNLQRLRVGQVLHQTW
jgi:hypothetical protein